MGFNGFLGAVVIPSFRFVLLRRINEGGGVLAAIFATCQRVSGGLEQRDSSVVKRRLFDF